MTDKNKMTPRQMLEARMKSEGFAVEGSGGKGGGGRAATEAPNTLRSRAQIGSLLVVSEGVIHGPVDPNNLENAGTLSGDKLLQAITFDGTYVQNKDGTLNFTNVQADWRAGEPDQVPMEMFPVVGAPESLNQEIRTDLSYTRTFAADVDGVRLTLQLPAGLYKRNAENGDTSGTDIKLTYATRMTGESAWNYYGESNKNDKTNAAYEFDVDVKRPEGKSGAWEVRITRVTPDSTTELLVNKTYLSRILRLYNRNEAYQNTALFGIMADAESTGGTIPRIGIDIYGIICQIPNNYNPVTHTYTTPVWNGGLTNYWTNNPAWIIYDMLTQDRYGMGEVIKPENIDIYSFYNAGVHCDELVNGKPRYVFTYPVSQQEDPMKVLTAICASFNCSLVQIGNKVTLLQDKKANARMIITSADVKGGEFVRVGTGKSARTTAADIIWNNPEKNYEQDIAHYQNDDAIAKYGYTVASEAAIGCMSYEQAMRKARWLVETNLRQTETISFTGFFKLANLRAGDIVEIFDNDYAQWVGAGRLLPGSSATTLKLDRAVDIGPSGKVKVVDPSGQTFAAYSINESNTKTATVTLVDALPFTPKAGSNYIVESTVKAKPYRILNKKASTVRGEWDFTAVQHDNTKYDFVESGVEAPGPDDEYTNPGANFIAPISGLMVNFTQIKDAVLGTRNKMVVTWDQHKDPNFSKYSVIWRKDNGLWSSPNFVTINQFEQLDVFQGSYEVKVTAINMAGVSSMPMSMTQVFGYNADNLLSPPINLRLVAGTSDGVATYFKGTDLHVQWDANPNNVGQVDILDGYRVVIINNDTRAEMYRTFVEEDVFTFSYSMTMNKRDGGPVRNLAVRVFAVDGYGNDSALAIEKVFSNPAPAQLTNLDIHGGYESVIITFDNPTEADYDGVIVWQGTEAEGANFPVNEAHVVFDGKINYISLAGMAKGVTYYYRIAAYDSFGKRYDGQGLNVSPSIGAATSPEVGVKSGPTLPTSGMKAGDMFYLTTTKRLYMYDGTKWVLVGVDQGASLPTTGMQKGDTFYNTTDGKLYTYDGTKWTQVGTASGTSLPSTGMVKGDLFYNTTDNRLYTYDGTKWNIVGTASGSAFPTTPKVGDTFFNTADNKLYTWNGTKWVAAGTQSGTALPATGLTGETFFNTTDGKLYTWNGTKWVAAGVQTSATMPSNPAKGDQWFNTNDNLMYTWNGSQWVVVGIRMGTTAQRTARTGMTTGEQWYDTDLGKLFTWNGSAWLSIKVDAVDLTGTITETQIAANAVTAAKLNVAALDQTIGALKANVVNSTNLVNGAIGELQLAANAVTAAKTQIAAIDPLSGNLAVNSVLAGNIKAGEVVAGKLATDAVLAGNIKAGAVTTAKLDALAVTAEKIAGLTITAEKIAGLTITAEKIAGGTITGDKIYGGTITGDKIAGRTIEASNIKTGAITANEIAALSITADKIAAGTITGDKIYGGTITAGGIYTGDLSASQIKTGTIDASRITGISIAANQITAGTFQASVMSTIKINASQITAGTIDAARIGAISIDASQITSGTISTARLGAISIDASQITSGTISTARLGAISISAGQITSGTIDAARIAASSISAGVIDAGKITTGTMSADRITSGTITTNHLSASAGIKASQIDTRGLTIKDANGTVIFGAGTGLDYSQIGGTKPPANATNGATFGVNIGGQINPSNVSTYIQSASIDTLRIKDNAVTVPAVITGTGRGISISKDQYGKIPGWGDDYNMYNAGSPIVVDYPADVSISIMAFWKTVPGNGGSSTRIHLLIDGYRAFAASNSNIANYAMPQTAAGTIKLSAGRHTFQLQFGNDWMDNRNVPYQLWDYNVILMGTMK